MNKAVLALLIISSALNGFLWKRIADQNRELSAREMGFAQREDLRRQVQELESKLTVAAKFAASSAEVNELARLRNEVGQLRQQLKISQNPKSVPTPWRRVPATADWSEKFAAATNELAHQEIYLDQLSSNHDLLISSLATASGEKLEDLRRRAQSRQCINHLKQIGLAARIWANEHGDRFPTDYIAMREELKTPKVLLCPTAPGIPATDWSQLNAVAITYTWHGSTADQRKPESVLTTCPIHGYVGLSDGGIQGTDAVGLLP